MSLPYRYYDVRRVTGEVTQIDIDNGVIEAAGTSFTDLALIRVLGPVGWGVLSVNGDRIPGDTLPLSLLKEALLAAKITNGAISIIEGKCRVLSVPKPKEDPRDTDLGEKTEILLEMERHAKLPDIVNTRVNYVERTGTVTFFNSSDNRFTYDICRCGFGILAVASRNGVTQIGYERRHTIDGLNIRHQQDLALQAGTIARDLLEAQPAKGGIAHAVLDPELAGVFAHEAVGHAAEGDLVQEGSSVFAGRIGERVGSPVISITDDPTLHNFGFCPVDDEGRETKRTGIIRSGVLSAYLHSMESMAALGEDTGILGHARGMAGEVPIVRMSNTFIENGDADYDEIIRECRNGILLKGSRGGQVDPGRGVFQFNAEYGYLIQDGECTTMVRDVSLSGDILGTLHQVMLCGNDQKLHAGFCGKNGQTAAVSDGAPHILLKDAVIGGSSLD
ncbi:MAG: TldD/PmbA family protein [Methanospirillaceae archaeon]|nr:TldD/PmbA family protein [Methanospirillaceae archaeon]